MLATSFALLVPGQGPGAGLDQQAPPCPAGDWNNDPDDIRNIVNIVSRDWKSLLTWQVVDPDVATLPELLQAPIIFFNGHQAPEFSAIARQNLREFVEQGGFLFAEACCGSPRVRPGLQAT